MAAISTIAAVAGTAAGVSESRKSRKEAEKQAKEARERGESAFAQIRDPRDILLEAYGEEGYYGPEVMETILGRERELMGPLLDLRRDYAREVAFGEGGLQEISRQTTEDVLGRMRELGPEFREAMEDPRVSGLVDEQLERFKTVAADQDATVAEREAAAKEFDVELKGALEQAGVSLDAIQRAGIGSARPFLERARTFGEGGFLGDIRGLTDIEKAEAERLTEEARGPLSFEAARRADQAARAMGGSLGRQLDASAAARAALGREEQVMAREDRAAAARARAAELAGLGGQLDLSAIGLGADIGMGLDKLGLSKQELASTQAMNLAKLQADQAAQARADALRAREQSRADREQSRLEFLTALQGAQAAAVDPTQIFFQEAQPASSFYASILGGDPGTIFTDPGAMINLGSATDVQRANILGGQAAIAAQQAAGASQRSAGYLGTAGQLLGQLDFSQMSNPFARPSMPLGTTDLPT
jgi:transposase